MRRGAYVGTAGVSNTGYPSIPMQIETINYLARFSSQPSNTYKNALNQAIYRWKAAGVYSLLQDLWLFMADTSADSLRNLVTAARDATISGSPTFTANKGFSGLGASNYVSMPFSATGIGSSSGMICAAWYPPGTTPSFTLGSGSGGVTTTTYASGAYGGIQWNNATNLVAAAPVGLGVDMPAIIGAVNTTAVDCDGAKGAAGTFSAFTSSPLLANTTGIKKMQAYGLMPTASTAQVRAFLSILRSFMEDVGALT